MSFPIDEPEVAKQDIELLANNVRSKNTKDTKDKMKLLGRSFVPGPKDVICARGKLALNHTGNRRFHVVLNMNLQKYSGSKTKLEKSSIVSTIVDLIRESGSGFVTNIRGEWYEVGDYLARQKVGQCLRDLLHTKYRSSNKAKTFRRKQCVGTKDVATSNHVTTDMKSSACHQTSSSFDSPECKLVEHNVGYESQESTPSALQGVSHKGQNVATADIGNSQSRVETNGSHLKSLAELGNMKAQVKASLLWQATRDNITPAMRSRRKILGFDSLLRSQPSATLLNVVPNLRKSGDYSRFMVWLELELERQRVLSKLKRPKFVMRKVESVTGIHVPKLSFRVYAAQTD